MKPTLLSKIILSLWLLFMGWLAWGAFGPSSGRARIDVDRLRVEFQQLPEFPGSRPLGEVKVVRKNEVTSVSQHYISSASFDSVLRHYQGTLPAAGWKYAHSRGTDSDTSSVKFCRSSVSVVIGVIEQGPGGTKYSVGTNWGKSPRGSFYCEASGSAPSR